MSGTSLDGVDIAYVNISQTADNYQFKIIQTATIPYTKKWKSDLKNGIHLNEEELKKLDTSYGIYLGKTLKNFIEENNIKKIDFIASHGHTIFHNPTNKYTLQIGNNPEIATITGYKTICDFRVQDVALGGQGAPLVPVGDELFFSEYDYCLNLGGFANISYKDKNNRVAFDICPVNIVLNHFAEKLNLPFDNEGKIASNGKINNALLNELNSLSFYTTKKPKSLGYEFVLNSIFPIINKYNLEVKDFLRTFVEHIAQQIVNKINSNSKKSMLITGGGAFNIFLIERLKSLTKTKIVIPSESIINYKEALVFALLGYLKNEGENNCLKSVTGAQKNHSSGVIFTP